MKSLKSLYTFHSLCALGGAACLSLLLAAYFIEYGLNQEPCSLCLLQRYVYWIVTLLFFIGAFFIRKKPSQYGLVIGIILIAAVGVFLSGRQIWLQNLPPDQIPPCTAGLKRLLEFYPVLEALKLSLAASSECAKNNFLILGLSLAKWSLLSFIIIILYSFSILFSIKKGRI